MAHHGKTANPKHEDAYLMRARRYAIEQEGEVWGQRRQAAYRWQHSRS